MRSLVEILPHHHLCEVPPSAEILSLWVTVLVGCHSHSNDTELAAVAANYKLNTSKASTSIAVNTGTACDIDSEMKWMSVGST